MKSLTRCAAAATAALMLTVVFVSAQERRDQNQPKPAQPNAQRQPAQQQPVQPVQPFHGQAGQSHGDRQLAACLISDNEGEVALAKFALQKSQNAEVKEFAEWMIQEHGAMLKKLGQFAPLSTVSTGADAFAPENRRDQDRPAATADRPAAENRAATSPQRPQNPPATATNPPPASAANPQTRPNQNQVPGAGANPSTAVAVQGAMGQVDLIRIKQEIGQKCVETAKKELGEKKGADFDKCFMGMQVGGHLHMADSLSVMKKYASPQLRMVLEEGEKTAAEHLDHAKHVLKGLEGESRTERTAAKEDAKEETKELE